MGKRSSEQLQEAFEGRCIVVAVTGGIAAYMACELVSTLVQAGAQVRVAMTDAARQFVGPTSFRALTDHPVYCGMFQESVPGQIEHISVAEFAEVIAVVPATANILGKVAAGICDDFVSTLICTAQGPVVVAPAMNWAMWQNPIVQRNCQQLGQLGYRIAAPESGYLACGEEGPGRLADLDSILAEIAQALEESDEPHYRDSPLAGKHVLITAGPTREYLDPVRFISNPATGKMGFALARAALARGAEVTVVAGPTVLAPPAQAATVAVESAADMHRAVVERLSDIDIFIGAGAVANFAPCQRAEQKISSGQDKLVVELTATPHVLRDVAASDQRPQVVVGFAAETDNLVENARRKLTEGGLDLVVANDPTAAGAGFAADTNEVTIVRGDGTVRQVPRCSKDEVGQIVIEEIEQILQRD